MPASIANDKLRGIKSGGTAQVTTVSSSRAVAGTSLLCVALTNWFTATPVDFITYKKAADGSIDRATLVGWKGIVSANTVTSLTLAFGTDAGNDVGDFVEMAPTDEWGQGVYDFGTVIHNADGTLKDGIIATAKIADSAISTAKIADSAATSEKLSTTVGFYATTTQSILDSTETVVTTYTEVADYGADFNHTTGVFTAPVTGFYHFDGCMGIQNITSAADGRWELFLKVGGVIKAHVLSDSDATNYDPAIGVSISIPLTAADTVSLTVIGQTGGTEVLDSYSYFSGYLVGKV